VRQVGHLQDLY